DVEDGARAIDDQLGKSVDDGLGIGRAQVISLDDAVALEGRRTLGGPGRRLGLAMLHQLAPPARYPLPTAVSGRSACCVSSPVCNCSRAPRAFTSSDANTAMSARRWSSAKGLRSTSSTCS